MEKIWKKTWQWEIHKSIEKYTIGSDYILDMQLIPYDIQWSIAHCKMLFKIWILTEQEKNKLLIWLEEILKIYQKWEFTIEPSQEDCHSAIESYLIEHVGEAGKKIHTGRSRNDQILVTIRLFTLDLIEKLEEKICKLIRTIEKQSSEFTGISMPGYTHTQRAMPTSVSAWLGSFWDALKDDLILLSAAKKINNQNPLWSAAWFWDAWLWLDRDYTTELLDFDSTQKNPIYCAYSRGKFEYITLQSLSQVMLDLWKLANDLVYFSAQEFDFFTLPDSFKTGSSIMPQKKNWDVMELVRWNTNLFLWYEFQIREIFKMLFSWYNRDFQLTKEPYLKWIEVTMDSIDICTLVIENLWVNAEKLKNACSDDLYATKEAYHLVKQGMNFRDAYKIIGDKYQ